MKKNSVSSWLFTKISCHMYMWGGK